MSISGALSNALSGLTANARAAQVTASNLSNALTPGYGRRVIEVAARGIGAHGGVRVTGVNRLVDPATIADRRISAAHRTNAEASSNFYARLETLVGLPDQTGALAKRLANFEDALIAASSRPDLNDRLQGVAHHADQLAAKFREISNGIQTTRSEADREIDQMIQTLNATLENVAELNTRISRIYDTPEDILTLQDERQKLIDTISEIVPVRVISRDRGVVGLFTTGGGILLDGPAPELSFARTPTIAPHMTHAAGLLSGITINGKDINIDPENGPLSGGALAAQLQIRDEFAPDAQTQIDALAREMIERLQNPAVDGSIALTDPALFTDNGNRFVATDEIGIAARVEVNASVSSSGSGEYWRLRDGLGATTPGNVGNAGLLQSMRAALNENATVSSAALMGASGGLGDFINGVMSQQGLQKTIYHQELGFHAAQHSALLEKERAQGVDSDQELQTMMLVEQSYAANARMIQTVDELIETLLRL